MEVLPLGAVDHVETMARFDASSAQCHKLEDREHLLSVIESGFGGFEEFNALAREMVSAAWPQEREMDDMARMRSRLGASSKELV